MKHFVLLHNIVTMAHASVVNSVEGFTFAERYNIVEELLQTISFHHDMGDLTDYQAKTLEALADRIRQPIE